MKLKTYILIFLLTVITFVLGSCSSGSIIDDPELYKDQIAEWENRISKDPKDSEALKNLGIFYIQTHQTDTAGFYIDKALELNPEDPALNFYGGLKKEYENRNDEALGIYQTYSNFPEESPYRDLMEGRYLWLMRQKAYSDIDYLIKHEEDPVFIAGSDSTIAVFPLIYRGINQDYIPLSRGFSEMISIDLGKVKQLTVLERVRIQAVLDELKFSSSPVVDQTTAPRAGKLLRAGTIVSGDYDISENREFKINLGSWKTQTSEMKSWVNTSGELEDLFILQKEIVFQFLNKNGIELTQAEKEDIAYIPTQNLEAFIEFSRGLLKEDAGDFKGAESFYQRAMELDPQFNAAGEKFQTSQVIGKSSGSKEQIVGVLRVEDSIIKNPSISLVNDRNSNLGNNISSSFIQGIDNRNPAQEGIPAEISLPEPPPPPQ